MPRRPKPPEWLTHGFWEATVFREYCGRQVDAGCYFHGVIGDPRECEGRTQACHFVSRQRVRNALEALLWECDLCDYGVLESDLVCPSCEGFGFPPADRRELIQIAEWDSRNAVPGCGDEHHARFDGRRVPPLKVRPHLVPAPVRQFAADWGLEPQLERRVA